MFGGELQKSYFDSVFVQISFMLFGVCLDKIESYPTTHVRVTPLSTFFPSYVAQEVDSGLILTGVVG